MLITEPASGPLLVTIARTNSLSNQILPPNLSLNAIAVTSDVLWIIVAIFTFVRVCCGHTDK